MSITTTIEFDNASELDFDSNVSEVINGKYKLKLIENLDQEFEQTFESDSGFIYDSNNVEFDFGVLQQINKRPANATFHASFTENVNGAWGDGNLTGQLINGATIGSGQLDCSGFTNKHATWDAELNTDSQQLTTVVIGVRPQYSGTPAENNWMFSINANDGSLKNVIELVHLSSNGSLLMTVFSETTTSIINGTIANFNPTAGQLYQIALSVDITTGNTKLFIDGVQVGSTQTATGIRSSDINELCIGSNSLETGNCNNIYDYILVYNTNLSINPTVPNLSEVYEYDYLESIVNLPQMIYNGVGNIQAFTGITAISNNDPNQIWNDLYFDGASWVPSDGSLDQSNTLSDILTNISTFPLSDNLDIKILFENSNTQQDISNLIIEYTGQIYSTSDPIAKINSSWNIIELLSFLTETTESGSNSIGWILLKNNIRYYYTTSWIVSDGTFQQSNTLTEIQSGLSDFSNTQNKFEIELILHSVDGSISPEIDSLAFSYSFGGDDKDGINLCRVWIYSFRPDDIVCEKKLFAYLNKDDVFYKNNIKVCQAPIISQIDANSGLLYFDLYDNVNMVDSDGNADILYEIYASGIKSEANKLYDISVPETNEEVLKDILKK